MKKMILVVLILALNLTAGIARAATDNQAPIADAGLPRYAGPDPVVLDGTGSYDPDESGPLSYAWRQVAGPLVGIIDANTATPTISDFVQTDEIQECEFELIVDDGELTSLPDTVKVIIVPDFGVMELELKNDSFDPDKPTFIFFGGGDCITGSQIYAGLFFGSADWFSKVNAIEFPKGYKPDNNTSPLTYYHYSDMIIVYLSNVAPNYNQLIQTSGHSTGGMPAIDVGVRLNLTYADARYAVNRVTFLDATGYCRDNYSESITAFLGSSVDGEQCWIDSYPSTLPGTFGVKMDYGFQPNVLTVWFNAALQTMSANEKHYLPLYFYANSLRYQDLQEYNHGIIAGAYWSVIGPGKNLQLASTPSVETYKFIWYGNVSSGYMDFYDEPNHPGSLPEPVTLIGPLDGDSVDANGVVLSCEVSENAIGYQLIFGKDPYHMTYLVSDTQNPPSDPITTFPFEQTWWTVMAYDQYGSTIYADPICINVENVMPQTIENITTTRQYSSIQQAINDALDGQEIVISPGIYQHLENINFKDKNINLRSTDPNNPAIVAATVINGGHRHSVVTFSCGKESSCVLNGLTITGGTVGISFCDASPTIQNCTVESHGSVAIDWYIYEPTIIDCNILGQINQLIDPRLVAYWKLDEAEGAITYDSVGEIQADLFGDPVWQPESGMIDGALALDGIDDFVGTWNIFGLSHGLMSALFVPAGQMSAFTWIKGGAPGQVVVSQWKGVNWLMADASQGYLKTDLKEAGDTAQSLVSDVTITDGEWHRVGLTWDGTNRVLYVDDVAVASDTQMELEYSTTGLNIGCGPNETSGTFFSGLIDDVRIYNRAIKP